MSCDTLTDFAAGIRQAVNSVNPEIRLGLCQSGCWQRDGNFTEPVARALAGETRPYVRIHGATYGSDAATQVPGALFSLLYSKQTLPDDFELVHESDSYPHNRFFVSAGKLKSLMAGAFSYGMSDSQFYTTQYLDDPSEESGYNHMLLEQRERFSEIIYLKKTCNIEGACHICHDPFMAAVGASHGGQSGWIDILGGLGIAYTTGEGFAEDKVNMISGEEYLMLLSSKQIRKLLSGQAMLDGSAAHLLVRRGFGELIGTDVEFAKDDKFLYEIIEDEAGIDNLAGTMMYNLMLVPAGSEGGSYVRLKPSQDAQLLTSYYGPGPKLKRVLPGMTYFENALGGRVAVTALSIQGNSSSTLYNCRKKQLLVHTLERLHGEAMPVFVSDLPNVFCIFNVDGSRKFAIATIINMCSDAAESVPLVLSPEWQRGEIEILDADGSWQTANVQSGLAGSFIIKHPLYLLEPMYLRITCAG